MKKILPGYILPSAAFTMKKSGIKCYEVSDHTPRIGDLVYGRISRIGHHARLENKNGRIHIINDGSKAVFVYGNRYAPGDFEGYVPESSVSEVDLLAQSGVVGIVKSKNSMMKDPTRVHVLGYVCDQEGKILNTRENPLIVPNIKEMKTNAGRSKLILVVGTSMNAGKSMAASACCWALSTMGHDVCGSKVTGTASLKDILQMNDSGAATFNDFTHFGYPSTYMLSEEELLNIFDQIDLKYCNNSKNFWVVEFADGILQRETAMLLASPRVQKRIHRLIFCAGEALGAIGGLNILKDQFGLTPDAISGVCSSSPLARKELSEHSGIPVFNNLERDLAQISELLL